MIYLRKSSVETPLQIPWTDGSMQCKQNNESMHANRQCYTQERNGFNGKPHNRMEDLGKSMGMGYPYGSWVWVCMGVGQGWCFSTHEPTVDPPL